MALLHGQAGRLTAKRGGSRPRAVAEHHITLLGTNTFQWPKGVPYSFAKSRETLEYTWAARHCLGGRRPPWPFFSRVLWRDREHRDTSVFNNRSCGDHDGSQPPAVLRTLLRHARSAEHRWSPHCAACPLMSAQVARGGRAAEGPEDALDRRLPRPQRLPVLARLGPRRCSHAHAPLYMFF